MFPDGRHYWPVSVIFKWISEFNYWCLSHIKNKWLLRISWGMRTFRWNMDACLGLLLVILKYSQWYFWSAVALACLCAGWHWGMNFSAVVWFGRRSKWIALISQEHCYLDCWMKMKCLDDASEWKECWNAVVCLMLLTLLRAVTLMSHYAVCTCRLREASVCN